MLINIYLKSATIKVYTEKYKTFQLTESSLITIQIIKKLK